MLKYYKIISNIFKNYRFYSINVLFYELIFLIFYNHRYNKFKYLESDFLSDSIPCPFLFLKKIERFTYKNNVQNVCDLGSGFGKILYFFGKICSKFVNININFLGKT